MDQFIAGVVCGAIGLALLGGKSEPKVVEVLPEEYKIITSMSQDVCTGPTGKETIAWQTVRTQTID